MDAFRPSGRWRGLSGLSIVESARVMLMGSHDQRVRMKQFLSDEEFREPILLHLPQNIVQDATQLVPEGVLA